MAAKAKAAARKAAAAKKPPPASNTKSIPLVQHDPTRPPPLALKDQTIFKQILHLYEVKHYSAALQHCNDLLERYPGHGETTAMAGLLHHSLNNKPQGYSLVKAGMKADFKSHIVWHVYGIITRADRNYTEAVKSYSQALRLDPDNHNILRDLAVLQIQVRQYAGYVESRWKLLRANRRSRAAWLSLAMAYVLNHQSKAALEVLDAMEAFEVIYEPVQSFERSESILFKASLLPPSQALEYLETSSSLVLDRSQYMLIRAQHLGELGRQEAAEWAWLDLIDTNEENRAYLQGYLSNRSNSENENAVEALKRLTERYPTSLMIRRLILDHATGAQFDQELESYLCTRFSKGIPSLYNDLKPLTVDPIKLNAIKTTVEKLFAEVSRSGYFEATKNSSSQQPPSTLVWILHFLSQLYGSSHLGMTKEAVETAQQAIQHTPSLPDCYISLAHAYKRAGSFLQAADALRSARELDGQDRFLNSKCAKYVLQSIGTAHQTAEVKTKLLDESRNLVGLFTRKDAPDPVSDLVDMQATWYVMAEAKVALRVGDWGLGLKRLHQVVEIFRQWEEDQYDFHTYCVRKNTFKAYQDLLKFEDTLYTNPIYHQAISKAIEIYLKLHDRNTIATESQQAPVITEYNILVPQPVLPSDNPSNPNANENDDSKKEESLKSKKALKKAKMAEIKAKAQAALEAKKALSKTKSGEQQENTTPDVVPPIPDQDPNGEQLLRTANPLEVAIELLKPIEDNLMFSKEKLLMDSSKQGLWQNVSLCRFEIELRRDKPLLALKALLKAHDLSQNKDSIDPSVFIALTKLKMKYLSNQNSDSSAKDPTIIGVLEKACEKIDLLQLPKTYAGSLARAESLIIQSDIKPTSATTNGDQAVSAAKIEEEIFSLFASTGDQTSHDWALGLNGLRLLEIFGSARTDEFKLKCHQMWSLADCFKDHPPSPLIEAHEHRPSDDTNHANITVSDGSKSDSQNAECKEIKDF